MTTTSAQDLAKQAAARRAVELCRDGMTLGLGSGSTAHFFVRALAERVADGLDVVGVPTSTSTRDLALSVGVRLTDLETDPELDLTVDGADELDGNGDMIKGGGAALLREKIISRASRRTVIVTDESKIVTTLGRFPLPIEVLPFGWSSTTRLVARLLREHGYEVADLERRRRDGELVLTDSGNYLLDVELGAVRDAPALALALNQIPGVVENGLFVQMADAVVVGRSDGTADLRELRAGA
ncbi:ribose-5-phosphate isomerase RpiA [Kineococcus rhizosphaerae]|uniref:Ribose-5-phosphate isomerase A n=1 Tax=Kineococcus rhizosphaerae TaxID=559628 RepID=A0A2T0R140_9ACTN|nr:ribose-5-phosphate isomerase RpiA [Kineococcus rhizosphaerae]PRY13042.1 ribose-5-phosphate isomerase [Kineococcus rhizosphaerae]